MWKRSDCSNEVSSKDLLQEDTLACVFMLRCGFVFVL